RRGPPTGCRAAANRRRRPARDPARPALHPAQPRLSQRRRAAGARTLRHAAARNARGGAPRGTRLSQAAGTHRELRRGAMSAPGTGTPAAPARLPKARAPDSVPSQFAGSSIYSSRAAPGREPEVVTMPHTKCMAWLGFAALTLALALPRPSAADPWTMH